MGTRSKAGPLLRAAYQVVTRLGAQPLRHELERLARRAGIDLEQPSARAEQRSQQASVIEETGLSPREIEVLQHLAAGRSNHQIARALFISRSTASVHVSHILRKLGVRNRVEAAGLACRLGSSTGPLLPNRAGDVINHALPEPFHFGRGRVLRRLTLWEGAAVR
jgi:DNA-binding CsgD family transcriptional regulator